MQLLGKPETNERFLHVGLYQGDPKRNPTSGHAARLNESDPTLFCTAYRRNRFYLFSRREPEDHQTKKDTGRDVLNEQPSKADVQLAHSAAKSLSTQVVSPRDSVGDSVHLAWGDPHQAIPEGVSEVSGELCGAREEQVAVLAITR